MKKNFEKLILKLFIKRIREEADKRGLNIDFVTKNNTNSVESFIDIILDEFAEHQIDIQEYERKQKILTNTVLRYRDVLCMVLLKKSKRKMEENL